MLAPFLSRIFYLHDESSVYEPGPLQEAQVGAAEFHQAVVVQHLEREREIQGFR